MNLSEKAMASDEGVKKLVETFEADLLNGNEEEVENSLKELEKEKPGIAKRILKWGKGIVGKAGEKALTKELTDTLE